jgi:hypothetical protein
MIECERQSAAGVGSRPAAAEPLQIAGLIAMLNEP